MRYLLMALSLLLSPITSTYAQISIGINIGINVPVYPRFVRVPGYPVYYAPQADWNFFFYDGLYWVYQDDEWYASSWYNGPWDLVEPEYVPLFILRVPVRYYRHRPAYFRGWSSDAPPRWGEHWGRDWEDRRRGWDQWNRSSAPPAAPLPLYQRQYSGNSYPRSVEQQHSIQSQQYHYQPREAVTRQHFQQRGNPRAEPNQQRPPEQQQYVQPNQQRQPQMNPRAEPNQQRPPEQQQHVQPNQQQQVIPRAQPNQQRPPDQQQRPPEQQQRMQPNQQQQGTPRTQPNQQRPPEQQQRVQPNQQKQQHPQTEPQDRGRKNKYEENDQDNQ